MPARPLHISLIAVPDALISTLSGIYDVLNSFDMLVGTDEDLPATKPFQVDIVGERGGDVELASGLSISAHRAIANVDRTDIVIVPSLLVSGPTWRTGRHPDLVRWLGDAYAQGATLCSTCSGIFLLAETGIFDGVESTIHWGYADIFAKSFPNIPLAADKVLIAAGDHGRLVTSGASTSWHDLVLYLIAQKVGPTAAQAVARFFALQWHRTGLAPYIVFDPPTDHGDALVVTAQNWLTANYSVASPVEQMTRQSQLGDRTFKRRFKMATGLSPIAYVQHLRVEQAKRRLERTTLPVDEISWRVGYEDPASFHRLFKRLTGLSPGAYRRHFQLPPYAGGAAAS